MTFGKLQQLLMVLVGGAALIPSPAVVDGFGVSTIHSRVSVIHGRTPATRSPSSAGPLLALFTDYDIDGGRVASNDSSINNRHSASDWLYNVMSLPKSSVLRDIRNPVLTIAVWGTLVSILQRFLATRSSNRIFQAMAANMCVGPTPHNFLVSSLGLLLVFRTNSAYQRFYEGRKIWENILSISRNFSRIISLYETEIGPRRKQRILNLTAAFPYLLRHHIRPGCLCENGTILPHSPHGILLHQPTLELLETRHEGDKQALRGTTDTLHTISSQECWVDRRNLPWCLTDDKSLKQLAKAQNRPLWVCDRIGRELMNIPYGPNFSSRERLTLLGQLEKLTNTVGQCERIHQTAVPLNYARHSLRSLTLWLFTLPFALIQDLGLLTGPVMGVIAWLLFGVYQIGYSIEDPFQGSLRLSILCDAIRRDVIGESSVRDTAFHLDDTTADDNLDLLFSVAHPAATALFPTQQSMDGATTLLGYHNATWTMAPSP